MQFSHNESIARLTPFLPVPYLSEEGDHQLITINTGFGEPYTRVTDLAIVLKTYWEVCKTRSMASIEGIHDSAQVVDERLLQSL